MSRAAAKNNETQEKPHDEIGNLNVFQLLQRHKVCLGFGKNRSISVSLIEGVNLQ